MSLQTEADAEADPSIMTHQHEQEAEPSLVEADTLLQYEGQLQKAENAFQPEPERETGKAAQSQKAGGSPGLQSPSDTGSEAAESVALGSDLERQASSTVESVISEVVSEAGVHPVLLGAVSGKLPLSYYRDIQGKS